MRLVDIEDDDSTSHSSTQELSTTTVSSMMSVRRFKDCVHDYSGFGKFAIILSNITNSFLKVPFGPAICAIIDTYVNFLCFQTVPFPNRTCSCYIHM